MKRNLACHMAMLLTALAGTAAAAAQWPVFRLPPGSAQHDLATSLVMNGVRLQTRVLDIAGPIHDVVDELATQFDPPLHALPHGEGWILAGPPDIDWLLVLSPRRDRTFGVVSSLAADQAAGRSGAAHVPAWLPAGVVQRMALQSRDHDKMATQHVFTHALLSDADMAGQVFSRLARAGWTSIGVPATASSFWTHGETEMMLSIVPAATGSGLLAVTTSAVPTWRKRTGSSHDH